MVTQKVVISEQTLSQNPLFWPGQGPIVVKNGQQNIFLGTGVATPTQLSQAVPFDALGFILSAEFIKRQIPKSQVFLLIADQHAWLANGFDKIHSQKIAQLQHKTFTQVINSLQLEYWHLFLASQLFPHAKLAAYETLENRDVIHFINRHQVGLKIGWKFSAGSKLHKTDEAHFDAQLPLKITSLFTRPGVTSNPKQPHESPYICTSPKHRTLLSNTSHLRSVINPTMANHLKRITILFERLIQPLPPKMPLETKLQLIIKKIFDKP